MNFNNTYEEHKHAYNLLQRNHLGGSTISEGGKDYCNAGVMIFQKSMQKSAQKSEQKAEPCVVLFNDKSMKNTVTGATGMFSMPVGGCEVGLTVAQSAVKELREETCGLSVISADLIARQPFVDFPTDDPYCKKGTLIRAYCVFLSSFAKSDYTANRVILKHNKAPHEWLETNDMARFSISVLRDHITDRLVKDIPITSANLPDLDNIHRVVSGRTLRGFHALDQATLIDKILQGPYLDNTHTHFQAIINNDPRHQYLHSTYAEIIM